MSFVTELKTVISTRPDRLIWVQTQEEARAERQIASVADALGHSFEIWRDTTGLFSFSGGPRTGDRSSGTPMKMAENLLSCSRGPVVVILEDVTPYLKVPNFARALRDLARRTPTGQLREWVTVVAVDPGPCPDGWIQVDLQLPDRAELGSLIDAVIEAATGRGRELDVDRDAALDALSGLTESQAQQALATSLVEAGGIDPARLTQSKRALISDGAITWYEPDPRGLDAVGGLRPLKSYLARRRRALTEGRRGSLPRPKGILCAGVPGTGKSLTAKAVASAWQVPLLRFDVGAAFGKYVGESESGVRRALEIAEAVAPCVLWIDEIEKGLAGAGASGDSDGGTTVRVFGTLLTWMQECQSPVYVVATANDPTMLPAELSRAGRFDRIWFVSVPNRPDRVEVARVMASKYSVEIDADGVADATENCTGAEIEHAIVEALWAADDEDREVTTDDVVAAAGDLRPVLVGWGESGKLQAVIDWASRAAVPANDPEDATSTERERFAALLS